MNRLQRLEERRMDPTVLTANAALKELHCHIQESESIRYTIGAMQPIDPEYTKNTYAQGDRVRDQLRSRLWESCDYEYQGSTTNDTHIKARSDIDLLVILNRWHWLEPPQIPPSPYRGDDKADMRGLRRGSEDAIREAFPKVEVDAGSKSLTLEGGSLTRRVDVVPATWYDTNDYARTNLKTFRGVRIFDIEAGVFLPKQLPFLHNYRIKAKDEGTMGGLRKAARLMKSLKYDSESVEMSSYDIVGIVYNIPDADLSCPPPRELSILEACRNFCLRLRNEPILRGLIMVPNGTRPVFGEGGTNLTQLDQLIREIETLRQDILKENARSFITLSNARVPHPARFAGFTYAGRP